MPRPKSSRSQRRQPSPRRGDGTDSGRLPVDGRDAAFTLIAQQARRYPNLAILPVDTRGLEDRESALAHRLCHLTLSRWATLRFLIETKLTKPIRQIDPVVQSAMLVGLTQMALLDRVPPHAAIGTAVEWAKARRGPKAGGMVNAVLRRLNELLGEDTREHRDRCTLERDELPLADGRALVLREPILPDGAIDRLAFSTGIGRLLARRWTTASGAAKARELALHSIVEPPVVLNTAYCTQPIADGLTTPHSTPGHALLAAGVRLEEVIGERSDIWVQDAASAEPVLLARDATAPSLICDVCAGQGTKTRQLRAEFPNATIVATDTDRRRLESLAAAFADDDGVITAELGVGLHPWIEKADLVLLDVPCSNSGVLPRRPEARARLTKETLERLGEEQRQIFADAIPLLSPNAQVLYATCSLEAEENSGIAAWAQTWHGFRIRCEKQCNPSGLPGEDASQYRDGSYGVLLGR